MKIPTILPGILILLGIILYSCDSSSARDNASASAQKAKIKQVASEFFATYAERENWEKLLSFYRQDMQFEDVMLQIKIFNKTDFQAFYNWPEGNFQKLSPDQPHLVLQTLAVNDSTAVGRGYFTPFYFRGELYEWRWGSEFTIWLYFDERLKIKRQIDFIEYPDWILEDVIRQYRER